MKKLKITILTALLAICCYSNVNAQATEGKTRGKVVNPGPKTPRIIFSAGYGNTMPSSTTKDAYFTNSSGISGDLFVPFLLFRKGWDGTIKGGNYGFTIAGSYNFIGNGNPSVPLPNAFAITAQTASSAVYKGVDPRNPGFRIGGGPQANFYLMNHLILSPIVLAEYFSTTQKNLSAVQTTQVNGQTKEYTLLNLPETKNTGFSVTPKLRISYFLAENFGIFADAGYVFGPKVNTQTTSLKPEGNPNQAGQYNQQQLDAGTQIKSEIKSTSYQAFAVNVGLSLAFGGKKGWNGVANNEDKGWNGKAVETKPIQIEEEKLPANIQALINQQDAKMNVTFQKAKSNQKVSSLCNFNVEKVEIECNGRDKQGNKQYKVKISYKNLSTSGVGSLGHYVTACTATATNGNYIDVGPSGSAVITNLLPSTSVKTLVAPLSTQIITFDFVPLPGFSTLNIMGNLINSATSCGNCDDMISLNLPNCCDGCEENPVTAVNNSIVSLNDTNGTISIKNTVSSPKNIVKIEADLVSVKITPNNNDCLKCNNVIKKQDHFVDKNQIIDNTGWASSGNPTKYGGENSDTTVSRSLTYTSSAATGINLSSGAQFNHTVGIAPASCCGDTVEIWIRYTVWDTECHVCDKLVKSTINRNGSCAGSNGGGTGTSTGTANQLPNKL